MPPAGGRTMCAGIHFVDASSRTRPFAKGSASSAVRNAPWWRSYQEASHGSQYPAPSTRSDAKVSASGDRANRDRDRASGLSRNKVIFRLPPKR